MKSLLKKWPVFLVGPCLTASVAQCVEYTGAKYPDPFVDPTVATPKSDPKVSPGVDAKKALGQLTIQGIMVSPAGSLAIVNGKIAKTGGMIQNFKIISIEPDGIVLESANRQQHKLPYKRGAAK